MKLILKQIILGCDPGYYQTYSRCPNGWRKFRRWFAFRIGYLPNRYRPWNEHQPQYSDGREVGTLDRTESGQLRYILPGEFIH